MQFQHVIIFLLAFEVLDGLGRTGPDRRGSHRLECGDYLWLQQAALDTNYLLGQPALFEPMVKVISTSWTSLATS
jgi:hypothetical protein